MANRTQLCIAGLLLLLSLLQTSESASISAYSVAISKMTDLGEKALTHLKKEAGLALKNLTGNHTHSAGCITEPKENERLNCSHIFTFISYLQAATRLDGLDQIMEKKLFEIIQYVDDLRKREKCASNSANNCVSAFNRSNKASRNVEKLRSLLELFKLWVATLVG